MFTQVFKRPPTDEERASALLDLSIFIVRGYKTVLDEHLSGFFGTTVAALRELVQRHPEDFAETAGFQITAKEWKRLRCPCGCLKGINARRDLPWAFTEEGIFKLASLVHTPQAIGIGMFIVTMLSDANLPPVPESNR